MECVRWRLVVLWSALALAVLHCSARGDLPPAPNLEAGNPAVLSGQEPGEDHDWVRSLPCGQNMILNSDFARDENRDSIPDGWVPGSSPSLIRDSAVGCRAVGKGDGAVRALWISGGRDLAGEWGVPLSGVRSGQTYLLSFCLFRKDFRNGWYPEVEIFGERHYLNQHTSYGSWQLVELLVTAPQALPDTVWFRFYNRSPARFWLSRPSLRPYSLGRLWAGYTRTGAELRWEESRTNLVLKMELSVSDAKGKVSRAAFLNADAGDAWTRLMGNPGTEPSPSRSADCFQPGLAWTPLRGAPPFRVRLTTLFQGREIAEVEYTLPRAGSKSDKTDLAGIPTILQASPPLPEGFYPIGIFDVPEDRVDQIVEAGFNTAHMSLPVTGINAGNPGVAGSADPDAGTLSKAPFKGAGDAPLRWMISALNGRALLSREELSGLRARSGALGIQGDRLLCLFAADEPELSGISPRRLHDYQADLRHAFPGVPTSAAVIRSRQLPYYCYCADWFLVDPYPVPGQPLTWMSDSLDQARSLVQADRVLAVVQAFGGKQTEAQGWERFPTLEEMRTLAFLAVVHGARGVFFYNYPSAAGSEANWGIVKRVVHDLKKIYPWLIRPASDRTIVPWVLTPEGWKQEPGRVHSAFFDGRGGSSGVLVVVNPSAVTVEVRFEGLWEEKDDLIQEMLDGRPLVLKKGSLIDSLPPRTVCVYGDVSL